MNVFWAQNLAENFSDLAKDEFSEWMNGYSTSAPTLVVPCSAPRSKPTFSLMSIEPKLLRIHF